MIACASSEKPLTPGQVSDACAEMCAAWDGKKPLFIIPDHTRSAPMDQIFRLVYKHCAARMDKVDFLIALGTHPPMSDDMIYRHLGITADQHRLDYAKARFYNHCWNDPAKLVGIGIIDADEIAALSNGLMAEPVEITVNKLLLDYDAAVIMGPVFPHEVVGFSGGNKYLFPGISGQKIIDMFHWLGALITNLRVIGTKATPVRRVIDRAASFIPIPRLCLSMVVKDHGLAGLFYGTPEEAWSSAADLSCRLHILYQKQPFSRVLSCAPPMYRDLWTGGKCMYKLEPVVADGGELIIYAPHISQISLTHGAILEQIGYHVRDYFLHQMERFQNVARGVMAHSTHVKGIGSFIDGMEKPRIRVSLATAIPPHVCRKINLDYRDPQKINIEEWSDREQEGVLLMPRAGEVLYRLEHDPFLE